MRLLFFGQTAEIVGKREIEVALTVPTNSRTFFAGILENYPRLKNQKLLFAVNQEYANGDENLHESDELAIFTAVSGG